MVLSARGQQVVVHHRGDTGPDSGSLDDGRVPDPDAGYVRNRVRWPSGQPAGGNPDVTGSGPVRRSVAGRVTSSGAPGHGGTLLTAGRRWGSGLRWSARLPG